MKSTNHLTELACRKSSTPGKKLSDGHGMYLLVYKNGSKYWRLDFRLNGKRKTKAIGVWPEISLTRARLLNNLPKYVIFNGNYRKSKYEQIPYIFITRIFFLHICRPHM